MNKGKHDLSQNRYTHVYATRSLHHKRYSFEMQRNSYKVRSATDVCQETDLLHCLSKKIA